MILLAISHGVYYVAARKIRRNVRSEKQQRGTFYLRHLELNCFNNCGLTNARMR